MSRVLSYVDSNHIPHRLVVEDGDLVLMRELKAKRAGELKLSVTHASVDGETVYVTQKGRSYEVPKSAIPNQ